MRLQLDLDLDFFKQRWLRATLGVVVITIIGILLGMAILGNPDPVPLVVRQKLNSPVIYPKTTSQTTINQNSYRYQSAEKVLTFSVVSSGTSMVLSEQLAPNSTSSITQEYYELLGLHPIAEIQTKLGLAVLVNFYASGDFGEVIGQDAALVDKGTLLIAQPAKQLSAETWKDFLDNLVVSQ